MGNDQALEPIRIAPLTNSIDNDLVEIIEIGKRRHRQVTLKPGTYPGIKDGQCVIVKKRISIQVEEEFRFTYPALRSDPDWFVVGYDLAGARELPSILEPPTLGWWTRLWAWLPSRHRRLPEARWIEKKA